MPTAKVTATLDRELLAKTRALAGRRGVSAYINNAVKDALQRDGVLEFLDEMDRKYGPPTPAERRAARKNVDKAFQKLGLRRW